jgi:hypothetical protein
MPICTGEVNSQKIIRRYAGCQRESYAQGRLKLFPSLVVGGGRAAASDSLYRRRLRAYRIATSGALSDAKPESVSAF